MESKFKMRTMNIIKYHFACVEIITIRATGDHEIIIDDTSHAGTVAETMLDI